MSAGARTLLVLAVLVAAVGGALAWRTPGFGNEVDLSLGRQAQEYVAVYFDRPTAQRSCSIDSGQVTVSALLRAEGGRAREVRWAASVSSPQGPRSERHGSVRLLPGVERRLRVQFDAPGWPYQVQVRLPGLDQGIDLRCGS